MEIWDAYYQDGTLAGQDLVRGEPIPQGLYHLVSEILLQHEDGDYLLVRRSFSKPNFPGYFEATAGGSALKGEDGLSCARRELFEETGIAAKHIKFVGRSTSHNTIYECYFCRTDCPKDSVILQPDETVEYLWLSKNEFIGFLHSDRMVPTQRERYRDFWQAKGYLPSETS